VKPFFGDTSEIAHDPEIDMVVVAVNAPYMKKALMPETDAKKDFFIEWPNGISLDEAEIADAAR
ncbi:hypothetical protein GLOTRDRAFT_17831, partial [Gloeophyllum trabeum ATCC 11539]